MSVSRPDDASPHRLAWHESSSELQERSPPASTSEESTPCVPLPPYLLLRDTNLRHRH